MGSVGKEEQAQEVAVVVVPLTAQSHLAQLLHLSLLLCSRPGLSLHYASSSTHIRQVKSRLNPAWYSSSAPAVTFHELSLPAFSCPPPNPYPTTTKFPAHLQPMFEAFSQLRTPVGALLRSISASARRVVVLHDALACFAAEEAAALPNAEAYVFHCLPALFQLVFCRPSAAGELQARGLSLPPMEGILTEEFAIFAQNHWSETAPISGLLMNTCRAIEAEFIDLVAQEPANRDRKVFAIGPVSPLVMIGESGRRQSPQEPCMDWLHKQPPASVVYVSFGTTTAISDEQVAEIAHGLLRSGQRFLWVLRDADRGDIYATESGGTRQIMLPPEFEANVEATGVGMVVRGWAPQLDILAHAATGAFMSHCGWNSTMETICMGVPVIAWPMHSDQPTNAVLVADYLRTGVAVREWTPGQELVGQAEVEAAIRRVMEGGEEASAIRERAKAMGEAVRAAMADGASRVELDAFVAHITRS